MTDEFEYFEHDGAYFRREKKLGLFGVQHIRTSKGWEPYKGDTMKPSMFGSVVDEKEATQGMKRRVAGGDL